MPKKLELMAYGPVGGYFGVSAQDFAAQLAQAPDAEEIVVRVHSEGGDALDGIAISNALRSHPGKVVCYVDGFAASAASMICMGADEVVMAESAVMMLHNPWGVAMGDGASMREQADALDVIGRAYVAGYARKSGRPEDEIRALINKYGWTTGTWMTAGDAVREKLADRVGPPVQAQARAGELRAVALANAPLTLRQILAGQPALPSARAAHTERPMTIKDWVERLRAAKTEQARAAVLAEMEKEAKAEAEDEKDGEKAAEGEDEKEEAKAEAEDEKDGDDDEKHALRATVSALTARVRELEGKKAEVALSPEAWVDQQVKAGYPSEQRSELLALRQKRPGAAEMAAKAVLKALPQVRRGERWTEGGAPRGTSPEASVPKDAAMAGVAEAKKSAEEIVKSAQLALQNRTRSGLAQ